jgi:hypothetical protein
MKASLLIFGIFSVFSSARSFASVSSAIANYPPQFVEAKPQYNGPNCWNSALVARGVLPALRYTSPQEMSFYMESPLCRELNDLEPRKSGDIVAIRSVYLRDKAVWIHETHGFVIVGDKDSFSKASALKMTAFQPSNLDDVLTSFRVPADVQCRGNSVVINSACPYSTSVYRCEKMDNFVKHSNLARPVTKALKLISSFEVALENKTMAGTDLTNQDRNLLHDGVLIAIDYARSPAKQSMGANNKFVLAALQFRLGSILKQLDDKFMQTDPNYASSSEDGFLKEESLSDSIKRDMYELRLVLPESLKVPIEQTDQRYFKGLINHH